VLFGGGLTALLAAITYGIQPYRGHPTGWTNPWVLRSIALAIVALVTLALGGGIFTAPNTAAIMSSVPAAERGAASGIRATVTNAGMSLSIGIFFSLMIAGLAHSLPTTLLAGLQQQGVPATVANNAANLPPAESLFAAFLGYNPIAELLASSGVLQQPGVNAAVLTGRRYFPQLISGPFHNGLVAVFTAAAVMMVIGAAASWVNTGRTADDSDD